MIDVVVAKIYVYFILRINYIYNLMIGVRIKPNQEISEFNSDTDREYINMDKDGYALAVPDRWEHKKCKLSFVVENYASDFNI